MSSGPSIGYGSRANTENRPVEVLRELSSNYYLEEGRRLKREKDLISRRTQPLAFVRLHWKIAFLSEFRNDTQGSLKYYTAAYGFCRDVPKEYQGEAKIIADYANFKLCKIFLQKYSLTEVISQFQRHARFWKQPSPYLSLTAESEHWGWVSRQYQVLGEMLLDSSSTALWAGTNPGYQHPAYYFHCAATFAAQRKRKANLAIESVDLEMRETWKSLPPLQLAKIDLTRQQYVGQIPQARADYEEPHRLTYEEWQLARRAIGESNVLHSRAIIDLLQKAHSLYSMRMTTGQGSCKRTKLFLLFEIAEEFFEEGSFEKAKEIYDALCTSTLRTEDWKTLSTAVYQRTLECAMRLKLTQDVIKFSLRLCSPETPLDQAQKRTLQTQMSHTINHLGEFDLPAAEPVIINCSSPRHSLIQVNCQFVERNVRIGDPRQCSVFSEK